MKRPNIGINANYEIRDGKPWVTVPESYIKAVYENGGLPIIIPPLDDEYHLDLYIELSDGFLFIGGDDYDPDLYGCDIHPSMELAHPRRTGQDLKLMKKVLSLNKPVLAICAGMQMMNIAQGGKLIPHLETGMKHTQEYYHSISVKSNSILEEIFGTDKLIVNSYHHQAVNPAYPGKNLDIIAYAPDDIPEALVVSNKTFQIAVQWHPERIDSRSHRDRLFNSFVTACRSKGFKYQ